MFPSDYWAVQCEICVSLICAYEHIPTYFHSSSIARMDVITASSVMALSHMCPGPTPFAPQQGDT